MTGEVIDGGAVTPWDMEHGRVPLGQALALLEAERNRANAQAIALFEEIDWLRAQLVEHGIEPRERPPATVLQ